MADIIALQVRIIKEGKEAFNRIREANQFTLEELEYCNIIFNTLLDDCFKNIEELFMVVTSGEVTMRDDERIKWIDKLYADMQDKYAFCSSFGNEISVLAVQRIGEHKEINLAKKINGLQ